MTSGSSVTGVRVLCLSLGVLVAYCLAGENLKEPVHAQEPTLPATGIDDFGLVSPDEGWLLIDNQLFLTEDNGGSWKNITPDATRTQKMATVFFLDRKHAWAGLSNFGGLLSNFVMERTDDGGATWEILSSSMLAQEGAVPLSSAVHMQWLDTKTGWLMIEESTGSSFSAGRLFKTVDGGITWAESAIPVGESVYFASANSGWAVGRDGDGLYHTKDGGASWQSTVIADEGGGNVIRQYGLPTFDTANDGLIPVLTREASDDRDEFRLYSTQDGGDSWSVIHRLILKPDSGILSLIPLDLIDSGHAIVLLPQTDQILRMVDKQTFETLSNQDGLTQKIAKIDMLNMGVGWAAWLSKNCVSISKPDLVPGIGETANCVIETRLLRTADSGENWSSVPLPGGISGLTSETIRLPGKTQAPSTAMAELSSTQVFMGQGFDSCVPPSLSQMQDWWNNSPYDVWNLYIGGTNRGCNAANEAAITASFISQLYQQGWQFIPTWVGRQAPCSSLNVYKMSSDPSTAYGQGVGAANAASDTVANLGFSNTIVYFDLEYFSASDAACMEAVQAFISGWTAQLHSRGNQAAVYGSACGAGVDNYYTIANVPDAIWPALWNKSGYDSSASVWGISCIPDSHWSNHQRIYQYAGGHSESWGSTTLDIDSNVLDGIVAIPFANCDNPSPDANHIGLYSEDNYCGAYTILGVGDYGNPSALGIANDSVSSIKVGADVEATLCNEDNYLGACEDFTAGDPHLGDNSIGDNQVSSAKVVNKLELVTPAEAAHVSSRRPPFDWTDVPGASGYKIQISRTAAFTALVQSVTVASSTYTPATDLPAGIVLYWRVRAKVSGVSGGWSEVRSFKTAKPPSVPVLKAPASGALLKDYTPFLDWYNSTLPTNAALGFDHYELQLATNASFTADVLNFTTEVGNRTASSYTIPDANSLIPNKTYYWHVRAYNTGGEYSTWSATSKFRTAILPPSLLSPPNMDPVGSRRPVFGWQDVAGASGYKVQISRTRTFTTMAMQASVVPSTFTPGTNLPAGTTLYWRVQATGKNGPSRWSSVWQFTTQ